MDQPIDYEENKLSINILDTDCLIKIFSYLPFKDRIHVEEVCQKWHEASQFSWTNVNHFNDCNRYESKKQFGNIIPMPLDVEKLLIRCGYFLTKLKLKYTVTSKVLSVIEHYCPNLVSFYYDYFHCDRDFSRDTSFTSMTKLKYLTIYLTHSAKYLPNLPENIEELTVISHLKFENVFFLFDYDLSTIDCCNVLNCLTLNNIPIPDNLIRAILQKTTLTYLNLKSCLFETKKQLVFNLVNLKYLNINSFLTRSRDCLPFVITNCYKLEYFNANNSYLQYKNNPFDQFGHLQNLKEIYIKKDKKNIRNDIDSNEIPKYIGNKFPNLKSLDCSNHIHITDNDIIIIIKNSPYLEYLDIRRTNITHETLRCAVNITKIRQNENKLQLITEKRILNQLDEEDDESPFLVIVTPPE